MPINTEDQLNELRELAYKTKDTVDRLETNWELDRKDFSEFQNRLGHLEVEFKTLRDQLLLLPKRTSEKIDNAVKDIEQASEELKDVIISTSEIKQLELKEVKKKHWWHW